MDTHACMHRRRDVGYFVNHSLTSLLPRPKPLIIRPDNRIGKGCSGPSGRPTASHVRILLFSFLYSSHQCKSKRQGKIAKNFCNLEVMINVCIT